MHIIEHVSILSQGADRPVFVFGTLVDLVLFMLAKRVDCTAPESHQPKLNHACTTAGSFVAFCVTFKVDSPAARSWVRTLMQPDAFEPRSQPPTCRIADNYGRNVSLCLVDAKQV